MIDWEKFKRGEFAVRCDTEDKANAFLKECREHEIKWFCNDTEIFKVCSRFYEGDLCFNVNKGHALAFQSVGVYRNILKLPILDYNSAEPAEPDQSLKSDAGKPQLSLVPTEITRCIAYVREYGIQVRGGCDSWREVEPKRLRDAAYRHWLAYIDNPDGVDAESGLPHLWHLAANVAFLCEMEKENK